MTAKKSRRELAQAEIDEIVIRQAEDEAAWEEPVRVFPVQRADRARVRRFDLAAKFHVLSVLYRLGARPAFSVEGERYFDLTLVRNPGEVVTVEVKAAADWKSWSLKEFSVSKRHFVVFVYFDAKKSGFKSMPESYILDSQDLPSWAKEHSGVVAMRQLVESAKDAREAWDRLFTAA